MKVAVTGASGLIGSALVESWQSAGHEVWRLVRRREQVVEERTVFWSPLEGQIEAEKLKGLDAVVHLAGENIAAKRWTKKQKELIRRSRVEGTHLLCRTLEQLERRPNVLVCASAVGYYGNRGEELVDETSKPGKGFLAEVCQQWEAAAEPARQAGIRTVHLRLGMVLSDRGGALARMLPLFKLGLAGRLGNGRQYWSWVTLDDVVRVVSWLLEHSSFDGPVNCTAPEPVTNRQFTRTLAKVLKRPAVLPAPAWALKLMLGQMAAELLLAGQRCVPQRLLDAGFSFQFRELEPGLRHVLNLPTH